MTERVRFDGVSLRYGREDEFFTVLREIDLVFEAGEFVVVSGYSGAGKSTLLGCINGTAVQMFDADVSGEVSVNGSPACRFGVGELARSVGTVLQDADSQLFNLQAEDEIAFGCENIGLEGEKIAERVDFYAGLMGVEPGAYTNRISGGEKQRLLMASVLAMEQPIVLLDEPLANIDGKGTAVLLPYLKKLTEEGRTVVVVEHRLDVILPYATRLVWMEEGRIAEDMDRETALRWFHTLVRGERERTAAARSSAPNMKNPPVKRGPRASGGIRNGGGTGEGRYRYLLEDVTAGYRGKTVFEKLSLSIAKGGNCVILGGNGSGKTTFVKLLAGLIKPAAGALKKPRTAGFVFQNPGRQLFMDTVRREVGYLSAAEDNTSLLLELFGLEHVADRHPLSLSEGQKRLVTVAASSAARPEVLLLDEPTVGQDYKSLTRMLDALGEMKRLFGTDVLFTTHDYRAAFSLADRAMVIRNGRIEEYGGLDTAEIYFTGFLPEVD